MARKKVVLIISKRYPTTHSRKGELTEFAKKIKSGEKIHTIRANYDRWSHCLDKVASGHFEVSLREWLGRPYNSKQLYIGVNVEVNHYQRISLRWHAESQNVTAMIDGKWLMYDIAPLAKNDGMTVEDFVEWFFPGKPTEDKTFTGIIIHFSDYVYKE